MATRKSGETFSAFYSHLAHLNSRQMEDADDRRSVLDSYLISCIPYPLMYTIFLIFCRNPRTGREAVAYATEFVQSHSYSHCHSSNCSQPSSGEGKDGNQVLLEVSMYLIILVLAPQEQPNSGNTKSGGKSKHVVCHGCR